MRPLAGFLSAREFFRSATPEPQHPPLVSRGVPLHAPRALVVGITAADEEDSVGRRVIDLLQPAAPFGVRVIGCGGNYRSLVDRWAGVPLVIAVDATSGGLAPGVISRFEVRPGTPAGLAGLHAAAQAARHGAGLVEAAQLGRAIGRLPGRLAVFGIEAPARADALVGLARLREAEREVANRILAELVRL